MKLGFDARDRCRCHELSIGIQDEEIARPVEDNASARPVFVFARSDVGAKGWIEMITKVREVFFERAPFLKPCDYPVKTTV